MARTKANAKKTVAADAGVVKEKKKRRMKRAKGNIRKLQRSTHMLNSKASISRVVREILQTHGSYKIEPRAMAAIQESAEATIISVLQDADRIARINGNRAGPLVADLHSAIVIGHKDLLSGTTRA